MKVQMWTRDGEEDFESHDASWRQAGTSPFTQTLSSRSPEPEQKTTEFNIPYGCVAVKGKVSEWKLVCKFVY